MNRSKMLQGTCQSAVGLKPSQVRITSLASRRSTVPCRSSLRNVGWVLSSLVLTDVARQCSATTFRYASRRLTSRYLRRSNGLTVRVGMRQASAKCAKAISSSTTSVLRTSRTNTASSETSLVSSSAATTLVAKEGCSSPRISQVSSCSTATVEEWLTASNKCAYQSA